jgi:hypothetical protein
MPVKKRVTGKNQSTDYRLTREHFTVLRKDLHAALSAIAILQSKGGCKVFRCLEDYSCGNGFNCSVKFECKSPSGAAYTLPK